jgi:tRNA G18 (ribose-2'-O)-methylase SpoU
VLPSVKHMHVGCSDIAHRALSTPHTCVCACVAPHTNPGHSLSQSPRPLLQETIRMSRRKDAAAVDAIRRVAKELRLPVSTVTKHAMNVLTDNRPHQGVMLDCGELAFSPMDTLPTASEVAEAAAPGDAPPVWIVLDEVSDPVRCAHAHAKALAHDPHTQVLAAGLRGSICHVAAYTHICTQTSHSLHGVRGRISVHRYTAACMHVDACHTCMRAVTRVQQNLGAIVRSAAFLGAQGVLVASRNCAPLSPAASKASAGTIEALPMHECANLPRTLMHAAHAGWLVVGADVGGSAVPCSDLVVDRPALLVLGSEGTGLRTNVRRACTATVRVAAAAGVDTAVVDSLNVSVATGVLLHCALASAAAARETWRASAASAAVAEE